MNNKDDGMTPDPLLMVASSGSMSDDQELEVMPMPDPAQFLDSAYDDDEDDDVGQGSSGLSMVMEPLQQTSPVQQQKPQYGDARKPTQQQVVDVEMPEHIKQQSAEALSPEYVATAEANQQKNSFAAEPERKHSKQVKEKKKLPPFVKYLLIALGIVIACFIVLAGFGYMMQSNRASDQIDLSSIDESVSLTEDEQKPTEVILPTPSKPAEKVINSEEVVKAPGPINAVAESSKKSADSELNARVDQITNKLNVAVGKISDLNQRVGELSNENAALKEVNSSLTAANAKLTSENELLKTQKPQVNESKSAPLPTKDSKKPTVTSKAHKVVAAKTETPVKKPVYKRPVVKQQAPEVKPQQFAIVRNTANTQAAPFVNANSVFSKPAYEVISVMNGKVTLKDPNKAAEPQVYSSGGSVPGYGSIAKISDNGCVQFTNGQNLCRR